MPTNRNPFINTLRHYSAILDGEMHFDSVENAFDGDVEKHLRNDLYSIFSSASIDPQLIDAAYLIGSYSRGTQVVPFSDVDVLSFSSVNPHIETILRWRRQLLTLYVYTEEELQEGIDGPDSLYWIASIKDGVPIHGSNDALDAIATKVQQAEKRHIPDAEQMSLPLQQIRRLIEYRRKAYAQIFLSQAERMASNDIASMQLADVGRKFVENFLLLKSRIMGRMIETETSIYDIVSDLPPRIQQSIAHCMSWEHLTLADMDNLMDDIRTDISRTKA